VYGITSLTTCQANPADILAFNRGHWGIENRAHHVRDVTFDEDRSQVRTGSSPQVMAAASTKSSRSWASDQAIKERGDHHDATLTMTLLATRTRKSELLVGTTAFRIRSHRVRAIPYRRQTDVSYSGVFTWGAYAGLL
jgi:hypothetical protein